jgi:IS5 family transposase
VYVGPIQRSEFERVIVDTAVQEKAVALPSDSRLLRVARARIAQLATRPGIKLRQELCRRRAVTAAARRRLRPCPAVKAAALRDVQRKLGNETHESLKTWIEGARRILLQRPHDSTKLHALHAPKVECIGTGEARQPFELGVNVSMAVTHRGGLVAGARSFPSNPYDGHTMAGQSEQATTLLKDLGLKTSMAVVDLGYRGVEHLVPVNIIYRDRHKTMTYQQRRWPKRRQAIEQTIGHAKQDHGMRRCWLKGSEGHALQAVLCSAGSNRRWLLRAIARGGIAALLLAFVALRLLGHWICMVTALDRRMAAPSRRRRVTALLKDRQV